MAAIESVETWECSLPLPAPIVLGSRIIRTRDYQLLRVTLDSGGVGVSIGYTRGLPVTELLAPVVAHYRGCDPGDPRAAASSFADGASQVARTLVRAQSLLDNALWDALARDRAQPLHALLGNSPSRPRVVAVCGYYPADRSTDDLVEEVLEAAASGHRVIKVVAPSVEPVALRAHLARLRRELPADVGLAVELFNSFADAPAARDTFAAIDDLGLDFIEDAFRVGGWRQYAASSIDTPFAAGEDSTGPAEWADLLDPGGVRLLRTDATASGGISAVLGRLDDVPDGVRIYPHVFSALHAQLAGSGRIDLLETTSPRTRVDPIDLLGLSDVRVDEEGLMIVDDAPGAQPHPDWNAVAHFAVRRARW